MAVAAPPSHRSGLLVGAALVGIAAGVLILAVLHLVGPTAAISPLRRTISEYQLTDLGWAFDAGVVVLATGSLALLAAFLRARLVGPGGVFGLLGWVGGLLILVAFEKHNWAIGPSFGGQVHRMASLVAFLCLPVAVMLTAGRRDSGLPSGPARWSFGLAVVSLLWFVPIVVAMVTHRAGGMPWWQAIPLGLVERGVALTEVVALATLGIAVLRRTPTPAGDIGNRGRVERA